MVDRSRWSAPLAAVAVATVSGGTPQQADFQTLGSPRAPVEITVFSDFECPYCRVFALAVQPGLAAEFVEPGRVRIRFVHFPLADLHPNAVAAARAAYCAGRLGRFWPYHDYLFVRQAEWAGRPAAEDLWADYAVALGLDRERFEDCLRSEYAAGAVDAQYADALDAGASGTPTILLQGTAITGLRSYETLRRLVIDALGRADAGAR